MPDNPYPGAKPLSPDHPNLLLGRDDLLTELASLTRRHTVLEIAGPSGVGKSSLMGAGLCGRMNARSELIVRAFAAWSQLPDNTDDIQWYACALERALLSRRADKLDGTAAEGEARLAEALAGAASAEEDPAAFIDHIQGELGQDLAIVFDQLEELLRDDAVFGRRFLATIGDVAATYPDGFTQVVSLREEYMSHLRLIEEQLEPSLWRLKVVNELEGRFIPDLVIVPLESTADADGRGAVSADRKLVDAVTAAWGLTRPHRVDGDHERSFDERRPGLLHLQAFLYSMWEVLQPEAGHEITLEEVTKRMQLTWPRTEADAGPFFATALERYVRIEMGARAAEFRASAPEGREELWRQMSLETERVAAALPEHLSSGSYKLPRGTDRLTAMVLTALRDLHSPVTPEMQEEGLPEGLGDGPDIAREVEALGVELARMCRPGRSSPGFADDPEGLHAAALEAYPGLRMWGETSAPTDIPAGRLRNETAIRTACELVVTYERAISWLNDSWIIRMTPSRDDDRTAAIVHDGFGPALREWSDHVLADPEVDISLPVSVTGKQVFYRPDTDDEVQALDPATLRTTEGLGWIGCNVTARFEGLTFKSCDLRSTLFKDCVFHDVTFEDCLTNGLLFLNCTFVGDVSFACSGGRNARPGADVIKTITFGGGCLVRDGELRFADLGGYGVFLDEFTGPWRIERCSFSHMIVKGAEEGPGAGPGTIVDSPDLSHLTVLGTIDGDLVIEGPAGQEHIDAPGIDIVYR